MNKRATETTLIKTLVDSMSMEDFRQYVRNDMNDCFYKLTEHDLIEEIKYTLDEDFLDEMLLTITENRRG